MHGSEAGKLGKPHARFWETCMHGSEAGKLGAGKLGKPSRPSRHYEGFYSLSIDEYESLESIHEKALFVSEHGALGAAVLHNYDEDLEAAEEAMNENYRGEYKNQMDYAIHLFDETSLDSIPKRLHGYVDYEAFKTDIFITDYFSVEVQGRCHVFRQC